MPPDELATRTPDHLAPPRTAVIGAGIAGLACARALAEQGVPVQIFEKARGPGGRIATRRGDHGRFDHGAQYFTARDPRFRHAVEGWVSTGVAARWQGRIVTLRAGQALEPRGDAERFVAVPRMTALARHLAADLDLECGVRVGRVERTGATWQVRDEDGASLGGFDAVVVATPAAQAVPLLAAAPDLASRAEQAELAPCLAVMVGFAAPLSVAFDAAFVEDSPLAWVACEASKPGREPGARWVLHASPGWSEDHLEDTPEQFTATLVEAFGTVVGTALPETVHRAGHRWRYARPTRPIAERSLYDEALRIGACGDWCGGDRVEAAWQSGLALADRMLGVAASNASQTDVGQGVSQGRGA